MLSAEEIAEEVSKYPSPLVVLTGGEPSLFVTERLIDVLHGQGKYIAIETNGTNRLPATIDWVTFSPKIGMSDGGELLKLERADEIKVVNVGQDLDQYFSLPQRSLSTKMYLQPCFVEDEVRRQEIIEDTIHKIQSDPRWSLSAQLHRFLRIP